MIFYTGLHQPSDARYFDRCCISINRLRNRKSALKVGAQIMLDSGAFTEISTHGRYRATPAEYASEVRHVAKIAPVQIAVSQDWMCEPFILQKTGLRVVDHQIQTIERYDALLTENLPVPLMPVLQGYDPMDYRNHAMAYRERLTEGMWVGVGSVCKRNTSPEEIVRVLQAVKSVRPDLRLHGFGVKKTALLHPGVRSMLYSADSMAWSFAARKNGRNGNDWREADAFRQTVEDVAARPISWWQPYLEVAHA